MRRVFYEEKHVVIVDVDGFELLFQNAGPVALSQQLPLQVKERLSVTQHKHTKTVGLSVLTLPSFSFCPIFPSTAVWPWIISLLWQLHDEQKLNSQLQICCMCSNK